MKKITKMKVKSCEKCVLNIEQFVNYSCGYCEQYAFDYNGQQHALCGKTHFNVKRIVVYQLKEILSKKEK